jgi:hypothetical protein
MYNKFDAKISNSEGKRIKPDWIRNLTTIVYLNALEMILREGSLRDIKEINLYGHRKDLDLIDLKKLTETTEIGVFTKKKLVPNSIVNRIMIEVIMEKIREVEEEINDEEFYLVKKEEIMKKTLQYEIHILNNERYEI